jgi:F-type H+/Na+-transporting ATPase subunit alpha
VRQWEIEFLQFIHDRKADLYKQLEQSNDLTTEIENGVKSAIDEFKKSYRPA